MQELLLVNPRKRRAGGRKKTRSAAQRAATARMLAANRSRNPARRKRRTSARRSNPLPFMHTASKNPRRRSTARSRRRNPISLRRLTGSVGSPMSLLKPALSGAVGAIAVNKLLSMVPVPAMLMTGRMQYVTRGAAAIAFGVMATKLGARSSMGADMARGSLTVTLVDAIRDLAGSAGINLSGGMGYYLPGLGAQNVPSASGNAAPLMSGMGQYVSGPGANVTPISARMSGLKGFSFGR